MLWHKSCIKGGPCPVQLQSVFAIRGRKTSFECLPLSDRNCCWWQYMKRFLNSDIWIRNEFQSFSMNKNWGSNHDKSINNILCWKVHGKTNHSVLAHLWCATEKSWFSQLAKYITQRNKVMSWWEPQLCFFVCLFVCSFLCLHAYI